MRKRRRLALRPAILSLIAAAFLLATCGPPPATVAPTAGPTPTSAAAPFALSQPTPAPLPVQRPRGLPEAEVSEVVDGDTIKVLTDSWQPIWLSLQRGAFCQRSDARRCQLGIASLRLAMTTARGCPHVRL